MRLLLLSFLEKKVSLELWVTHSTGYFSIRSESHLLVIRKLFHLNFQLSILPIFFLVNLVLIYLSYEVMNSHQIALKYSLNGIA